MGQTVTSNVFICTRRSRPGSPLDLFAVKIDLSAFGISADANIDRVRLHLFDNGLGSKGADIVALGALNSSNPVPEPNTALLLSLGLVGMAARRRSLRG